MKTLVLICLLLQYSISFGQKDTTVTGLEIWVLDKFNEDPIEDASIFIKSNSGFEVSGKSDEKGFYYTYFVNKGDSIEVLIQAQGYLNSRGTDYLVHRKVLVHEYRLAPGCKGGPIRLPDFKFEEGIWNISHGSDTLADFFCEIIKDNPDINLELMAFSDATEDLSIRKKRCESVKQAIIEQGCSAERISCYDTESRYIQHEDLVANDPEDIEEIRKLNRVVEVAVVNRKD